MCTSRLLILLAPTLALILTTGCLGGSDRQTLAELRNVEPDLREVEIDDGIELAMSGYRKFLEDAPESSLTPEAMRRLADLKLEKEFGLLGGSGASSLPAPEPTRASPVEKAKRPASLDDASRDVESRQDFERRATGDGSVAYADSPEELALPGGRPDPTAGPLEAIALYDRILETYPDYPNNDQVLYQKARAFDELGRNDEAMEVTALLIAKYPRSVHIDEVQFRRAEYFFVRKKYFDAEKAYGAIVGMGPVSDFYELALYKLGWTLYKQMFLEEALEQYIALLDYKVSLDYDFDQTENEADQSRISDTYRVISLCFSDLGGTESVSEFFATIGPRSYEHRVYRQLGEFYLEKLRYEDAASVYRAFVNRYPYHEVSPHFSMRVVEIYEAGEFPKLVLEAKKSFASDYGLRSTYWTRFEIEQSPEVIAYLKDNLTDLANHYHAVYQSEERPEEKQLQFSEAVRWYQAYLDSFSSEPEAPALHYQLADLHLENRQFAVAASEYERTAYDYPPHPKASAAGYAAIYAHREHEKTVGETDVDRVRLEAVTSTLRFVDRFPQHEHAATVLGAAADDLFGLGDFERAVLNGQRLIGEYPEADLPIRRAAWAVVAHSSFEMSRFEEAEAAYLQVLGMTPPEDESHAALVDNLAASIYKQGELARESEDHRGAAGHFLRISELAPTSTIRPGAEYDAGASLIALEDWVGAARVFESFRDSFPDHELSGDATRQIAFVHREDGNPSRAAEEYERVASEAADPEVRQEALLVAGTLYEEASLPDRALTVYQEYVDSYATPIESVVVTRSKIAELHDARGDHAKQEAELRLIIGIDAAAGENRTDIVRVIAAKSALILSEKLFLEFVEVELNLPFEKNLQLKQRRMDSAMSSLERLIDYEVGDVTAAATYYMAEIFGNFSRSLLGSERPGGLSGPDLQDYEMVLEEEAYPFEERAIEFHEKNLELMTSGVYNDWIEKSLAQLAVVMPGRYAKFESSSGPIESVDVYAYQEPAAAVPIALGGEDSEPEEAEEVMPLQKADADEVMPEEIGSEEAAVVVEPGSSEDIGETTVPAALAPTFDEEESLGLPQGQPSEARAPEAEAGTTEATLSHDEADGGWNDVASE